MVLDLFPGEFPPAAADPVIRHKTPTLLSGDPDTILSPQALPSQIRARRRTVSGDLPGSVRDLCRADHIRQPQGGSQRVGRLKAVLLDRSQMKSRPHDFKSVKPGRFGDPVQFLPEKRQDGIRSAFICGKLSGPLFRQGFFAEFFPEPGPLPQVCGARAGSCRAVRREYPQGYHDPPRSPAHRLTGLCAP